MKSILSSAAIALLLFSMGGEDASGRGFGGFRAGGFSAGGFSGGGYRSFSGFSGGGYSGFRSESAGGFRTSYGGSYSGSRSTEGASGWRGGYGATSSYDRSFSDARGGSISASGTRSAAVGPWGGAAAGGTRDVSATTAGGRTYSGSRTTGAAVGPYGRSVGGSSYTGYASGPRGSVAGASRTGYVSRLPTDMGLSRYSSFGAAGVGVGHSTAYWSHSTMVGRAGYVRTGFGYYNCFHPAWYTAHPGCWMAAGWAASAAWNAAAWSTVASFCSIPATPVYYDYGSTVVYQDNSVYVNGTDEGSAASYAKTATAIADKGQKADAPPTDEWKALGVFALVQGDEKNSNNIFQLAVNKEGVIRGNYYDGLMDQTSPVFGSVDQKSQRAAWTIGKKNERVFETGIFNLTKDETPVLVHIGADRTQQWLLVRVQQPKESGASE